MRKKIFYGLILLLFLGCKVPKEGELLTKDQSYKIFKKYARKNDLAVSNYSSTASQHEMYHVFSKKNNPSPYDSRIDGVWIDMRTGDVGSYEDIQPAVRESTNDWQPKKPAE
ncbi:MAG TPA: hypothetical protein VKS21_11310 [Spirochaetota bacterium]|nr:hypothetical protein [Spirochaetota bacterium]